MTQTLSPQLLSPVSLGALSLPNRVVMAPLTRSRSGSERIPNPLMATYYLMDLQYPASAAQFLGFLQEYVIKDIFLFKNKNFIGVATKLFHDVSL